MKIYLAKDAGYCFGVRDAVNLAYDSAKTHGEVYMLGTIVHNERVINDLSDAGAKVVNSLDEVPSNKPLYFVPMVPLLKYGKMQRKEILG